MAFIHIPGLFLTLLVLTQISTARAKVPAIIVFGDSSVDSGNNNVISTVLKSNFRPYGRDFEGGHPTGRFCNGRIPPDFISEAFGLKHTVPAYLDPAFDISDFATGVCFASAGTGYDNATSNVLVSQETHEQITSIFHTQFDWKTPVYVFLRLVLIPLAECDSLVEGIGVFQGLPK